MKHENGEVVGLFPEGKGYMETFSGRKINPLQPYSKDVHIDDIAHHLSLICRFNGACLRMYSVGEHSIHVANLVEAKTKNPVTRLAALLHDAAEAYLGDIIRPIKYNPEFRYLKLADKRLTDIIMTKYGINNADWKLITDADNKMVVTEAYHLMKDKGADWEGLPPPLKTFKFLTLTPLDIEFYFKERFEEYLEKL